MGGNTVSVFSGEQLKNEFSVSLHLCKEQLAKIGKIMQQVFETSAWDNGSLDSKIYMANNSVNCIFF